ncbi:prephenate dehydratase [Treponema sp.]|uniref:prephenate dehydratase n=1 Tax=Treponema sp. TaxID=166 RepID=UPI00298E4E5B|nr:prephenate dehydratase domain-containing protein [Treponema sp.]
MSEYKQKKIAYCGIKGAWAYIAADKLFPDEELVSYPSFAKAYESVENQETDFAVLPVENSFAGDVNQVFDLMFHGCLKISNKQELRISQTLLGVKGTKLSDIKTVVSHPQAIDQCMEYIQKHGFEIQTASNTAVAANLVSETNDKTLAAIGSEETAKLYNLDIIEKAINSNDQNTTRFLVFSKEEPETVVTENVISIVMFTVKNIPGSLAKAVSAFGDSGYNMRSLKSHPVKNIPWQYYFYVEVEGTLKNSQGAGLLEKLNHVCIDVVSPGYYIDSQDNKNV